jgi:hypothetical protein
MSNNLKPEELEQGKIYFISFGESTQLVVRFKELECTRILFYDHIHYWNSFETFNHRTGNNYCVTSGIEELRQANLPEKHSLIKFELENNCI